MAKDIFELEFVRETPISLYYVWLEGYLYAYKELLGLSSSIVNKTFAIYKNGKAHTYTQKGNLRIMKDELTSRTDMFFNNLVNSYLISFKKLKENPEKILDKRFIQNLIGRFVLIFLVGDMDNKFNNVALQARKETEMLFPLINNFFQKRDYGVNLTYNEIVNEGVKNKSSLNSRAESILKLGEVFPISSEKEINSYLEEENIVFQNNSSENSSKISGRSASSGIVKGRAVLVLSSDDLSKVKKDSIIISTMTSPEFVVVMEKAKAIVTDEGGMSSHAAIVSREMGIPCIVGTENATKILKDGDLIEVDANEGIVRKL